MFTATDIFRWDLKCQVLLRQPFSRPRSAIVGHLLDWSTHSNGDHAHHLKRISPGRPYRGVVHRLIALHGQCRNVKKCGPTPPPGKPIGLTTLWRIPISIQFWRRWPLSTRKTSQMAIGHTRGEQAHAASVNFTGPLITYLEQVVEIVETRRTHWHGH